MPIKEYLFSGQRSKSMRDGMICAMMMLVLIVCSASVNALTPQRDTTQTYAEMNSKYYSISLRNVGGLITFNSVDLIGGAASFASNGSHTAKLMSSNNRVLGTQYFDAPQGLILIKIPYNANATSILLEKKDGSKVASVSIGIYAKTCGNGRCEEYESYESCKTDCPSGGKDDFCDRVADKKCDPDCTRVFLDPDCVDDARKITTTQTGNGAFIPIIKNNITEQTDDTKVTTPNKNISRPAAVNTGNDATQEADWITIGIGVAIGIAVISLIAFILVKRKSDHTSEAMTASSWESGIRTYIQQCLSQGYSPAQINAVLVAQRINPSVISRLIYEATHQMRR